MGLIDDLHTAIERYADAKVRLSAARREEADADDEVATTEGDFMGILNRISAEIKGSTPTPASKPAAEEWEPYINDGAAPLDIGTSYLTKSSGATGGMRRVIFWSDDQEKWIFEGTGKGVDFHEIEKIARMPD